MRQELEKIRRRLEAELSEAREQLAEKTSQLDDLQAMMNRREEELQQALNKFVHSSFGYHYYETRTHSTQTDRKTDRQTENKYKLTHWQ